MNREVVGDESGSVARVSPIVLMPLRELMATIAVGVGVGLLVALVAYLMNTFVFGVVLCRPQSSAECGQAPHYAAIVAMIVGAIAGVVALARLRVYRPLLIVIAATIALWGVSAMLSGITWYWSLAALAVIFGLVYGLFSWASRLRSFILAVVIVVVLIVAIRYMLVA